VYYEIMRKPFEPIWKKLPEETRNEILAYAIEFGGTDAANKYFEESGFTNKDSFYAKILRELGSKKKLKVSAESLNGELTEEESQLLEDFKNGTVGYDRIQKELATRVFKKILMNPEAVNVRDWLQSELVKLKQDETTKQRDALAKFINALFGGFIPSIICPHCKKSTIVRTEALGDILDEPKPAENN